MVKGKKGPKAKAVHGDEILKALERGDQPAIDATLAEIDAERDAKINAYLTKHPTRNVPWGMIGVTEDDMAEPQYASGLKLRYWRGLLELGQVVVAEAMEVTQARISQIESDDHIPRDMRWRLWNFIFKEAEEKTERDTASRRGDAFLGAPLPGLMAAMSKGPLELAQDEINLLKRKVALVEQERDNLKKLLSMELYDRCVILERELQKALEANAEYVKLFSLKGQSVAADELQETIEAKIRKRNP